MPRAFLLNNSKKKKKVHVIFQDEDTGKSNGEQSFQRNPSANNQLETHGSCSDIELKEESSTGSPEPPAGTPEINSASSANDFKMSENSAFDRITPALKITVSPNNHKNHDYLPEALGNMRNCEPRLDLDTLRTYGDPYSHRMNFDIHGLNGFVPYKAHVKMHETLGYPLLYPDPRIPFTNYYLNLAKLHYEEHKTPFPKSSTPPQSGAGKCSPNERGVDQCEREASPVKSGGTMSSDEEEDRVHRPKNSPHQDSNSRSPGSPCSRSPSKDSPVGMHMPVLSVPRYSVGNPFSAAALSGSITSGTPMNRLLETPGFMQPPPFALNGNAGILHPAVLGLTGGRQRDPNKPPPVKKYKCDVCGKAFSRSNTLVTHKRIHTGDKPFKCEVCGRAFRQPGNLTRHRLTHTTVKPYVCPTCNKAFNRASNLHTHMRTHTNYKPFVCPFCGKGFHQKIDMKIHSYTHTGEKPHKCKVCGRGFKQLTHLTYHLRTHSDEKMYHCEFCGKGFNQKGNLQAHIYGHTGERPHRCDICGKGFTLASTLNTHRRTHAEHKPFACEHCGKDFYQKNALKSHLIASHPYTGESLL